MTKCCANNKFLERHVTDGWRKHSGHLLLKKLRLDQISVNRIYQRLVTNILCSFLLPVLVKDELEKLSEKLMMMAVLHFVCARNTLPPPGLVRVLSWGSFRLMRFKAVTMWQCHMVRVYSEHKTNQRTARIPWFFCIPISPFSHQQSPPATHPT